jgi:glycogen debranching enzyme
MSEPSISELNLVTLKHGNSYAIFDRNGDISPELGIMGVYIDDMRYLSGLTLLLGGLKPLPVGAQVTADNAELIVNLVNPVLQDAAGVEVPENSIHLKRRITLCNGVTYQAVTIHNYNDYPVSLPLGFKFDSDFVDMFNVRSRNYKKSLGVKEQTALSAADTTATFTYKGIDKTVRQAGIHFSPGEGVHLSETGAEIQLKLPARGKTTLYLEAGKLKSDGRLKYQEAVDLVSKERADFLHLGAQLEFSNPLLQEWFDRSANDLAFLTNRYDTGLYPCAGVPWFAVPFGRDGIITALEMLWAKPDVAKGVLQFLSGRQAQKEDASKDAEPGKIMHETRENEMSRVGMVPFSLYYGGIDTTLLYVILAGEYLRQTNDTVFIKKIWPNIQASLKWIETYAEDKNWSKEEAQGFIMYQRKLESGLYNQMWKDSQDSVFYENGDTNVKFPRASCEVQGYAYAAWNTGKKLAETFQEAAAAKHYGERAETLYKNFNDKFWDKEGQYYVSALDGEGKPCRVKASNMGQLLFTGIVPPDRAEKIVSMMMSDKFFSGFGIRTVADDEKRYNPLSYHNGSIWPHDTALIAAGMGKAGKTDESARLFSGLMLAAKANGWRLPELFGGFKRENEAGPVPYPHACSPQAWAAAAPFQLLQAVLGLEVNAASGEVKINAASWRPEWGTLKIKSLPVGEKAIDVEVSSGDVKILQGAALRLDTRKDISNKTNSLHR